ncbi:MAG: hypothetical protein MUC95_04140 [Spirochaetes bacterium]|nr:hypothetical protein [Spirochaetota bacterium]
MDGLTEILFSSYMLYYNLACGINVIILIFFALEVTWYLLHLGGFIAWKSVNGLRGFELQSG